MRLHISCIFLVVALDISKIIYENALLVGYATDDELPFAFNAPPIVFIVVNIASVDVSQSLKSDGAKRKLV
jgi:hypothetical protein